MDNKAKVKLLNPTKIKMSKTKAFAFLTLAAFISAFSSYYFIMSMGIYTSGLSGVANGLTYTIVDIIGVSSENVTSARAMIYLVIYGVSNIPIIYLTYRWFSRRFLIYSLYYLIVNIIVSFFFANVPGFKEDLISNSFYFGRENLLVLTTMVFAIIGGTLQGIGVGLAFKTGSCTMGLDPVVKHISREKDISIVPLLFAITIINTTIWIFVRAFTNPASDWNSFDEFVRATFMSPGYISSWLYVGFYSVVTGAIYSNKKVEIFIRSNKSKQISEYFNSISYHRGHTIFKTLGGYSKQEQDSIQMIVNSDEMHDAIERIAAIDGSAFISITRLLKVYDVNEWKSINDDYKDRAKEIIVKEEKKRITNFNENKKNDKK